MKTCGKLWLFTVCALVCGCPGNKRPTDAPPEAAEAQDMDPRAELEAACFDGDPAACDQLGH